MKINNKWKQMKIKGVHQDWKANEASIQNNSKSYTSNSILFK